MATTQIDLEKAAGCLPQLIVQVMRGEEVIITKDDAPVAKLVGYARPRRRPVFGSARGLVTIADDFDETLEDFKEYME
jgi:antitoxin (DNA-binding transcriptional repressor) of toxin-antitoxin stability system